MSDIQYPVIEQLKFVNGEPGPDQESIQWVFDGEPVIGANEEIADGGVLNRPAVSIQENVTIVQNNVTAHQEVLEQLIDNVNTLVGQDSADHGERISTLENNYTVLNYRADQTDIKIGQDGTVQGQPKSGLYSLIDSNTTQIGNRNPLDIKNGSVLSNDIWSDLWWFKSSIVGNKSNYDPNGNPNPFDYSVATGMQAELQQVTYTLDDHADSISDHESRIVSLEQNSTVGAVTDIRTDLGLRTDPDYNPSKTVFERLGDSEDQISINTNLISDLNTTVTGPGGIDDRVTSIEGSISSIESTVDNNVQLIQDINDDLGTYSLSGTVKSNVENNYNNVSSLWVAVGDDSTWASSPTSIRYRLNEVELGLGDELLDNELDNTVWGYINRFIKSTSTGSIIDHESRIVSIETGATNYDPRISYLETLVGDSGGGRGQGFSLDDSSAIRYNFLNGTTNPTYDLIKASHTNGVEFGTPTYPIKLFGTSFTYNGNTVVTSNGTTFTGYVKGLSPVAASDFATKGWTDLNFVNLAGGTLTGQLKGIAPVSASDLTRKDWVENLVATADYLSINGGTVGGDINGLSNSAKFGSFVINGTKLCTVDQQADKLTLSFVDTGATETQHKLQLGKDLLTVSHAGNVYDLYHEGNKPTPSDIGAIADAPANSITYSRNNSAWVANAIQSDAPLNTNQYVRKNGAWAIFADPQNFSKIITINSVNDFPGVTANTTEDIVLQDTYTYSIQGVIDIASRKFRMDTSTSAANINCALIGNSPLTSKLISSTTSPLFTAESIGLTIENIGISTGNKRNGTDLGTGLGDVFNLTKPAGFSFVTLKNVDIDNAGGLGTISNVNKFEWTGNSFVTFLHGASGSCSLKFRDSVDIILIDGITPHRWTGELIDMNGVNCAAQNVWFRDFDIKISEPTQRIFSTTTNDSSLSATGLGLLSGFRIRKHHDSGLGTITDQQFSDNVRSNYFLGGIAQNSINWTISDCTNVRNSETYAIISDVTDTPGVNITTSPQLLLGNTALLSNVAAETSRTSYAGTTGSVQYNASDYGRRQLDIEWTIIPSADFTLTFEIVVESPGQAPVTISSSRNVVGTSLMTVHSKPVITIGQGDKFTVNVLSNTATTIRSINCAVRLI